MLRIARRIELRTIKRGNLLQYSKSQMFFHNTKSQWQSSKPPGGIKGLMKKYGYTALGVYLGLSAIDLPLCYILVASVGDEKIEEWKTTVLEFIGWNKKNDESKEDLQTKLDEESKKDQSTYGRFLTTFAIAYGIHKSLVIFRVPITASITPFVAKTLQRWGFNVGKSVKKTVKAALDKSPKQSK